MAEIDVLPAKIDLSDLDDRLKTLTGRDYKIAEREARRSGETMPLVQFSSSFQAYLGGKALGKSVKEIDELPINEYTTLITRVGNFLFSGSVPATEI